MVWIIHFARREFLNRFALVIWMNNGNVDKLTLLFGRLLISFIIIVRHGSQKQHVNYVSVDLVTRGR